MRQNSPLFRVSFVPVAVVVATSLLACAKSDDIKANGGSPAGAGVVAGGGNAVNGGTSATAGDNTSIIVNGVALTPETIRQMQQLYPVKVPPGRYWYDAVSGGWGREGEPIAGQMMPNLSLGGTLAADASGGTSGVFINGRQITVGEKGYIEQMCQQPVVLGRYWIMANGIGGYEGGAAFFNLAECPGFRQQSSGPRSMSRTYCDANGACTSTGILGSITTY